MIYCWFSPNGEQLWYVFANHDRGIEFLSELCKNYTSRTYAAQMALEEWYRHGISPFIQWPVQ